MPVVKKQKRIIITPYKMFSNGAKQLQEKLKTLSDRRVLRIRKTSTKFKPRQSDVNIFWGKCDDAWWSNPEQETAKNIARNKLKTFKAFKEHGISHPEWTTDYKEAMNWWSNGTTVVGRRLLTGHSGEGIILFKLEDEQFDDGLSCKLYVKYIKKEHEYRVHVFNGKVIDIQQKKRKVGFENRNNQIRNHKNGWVYCRENITKPEGMEELAVQACSCIGLTYGAVDIIYNKKQNKCYVLEINTAPGLINQTALLYATNFKEYLNV
ncbi:MAG TPA: ATP-grasp domain-containing protein [Chitinophagales bacterium]|nr:ATP-grasp domain-containing protein [Chitinophagales bacterium]HMY41900.1 ATP-grasp domain-containing protein [Chitinophagales bacterium]